MAVTRGMRYLREQDVAFVEHRYEHRVKGAARLLSVTPIGQ
jgi:hypothetical protein